MSSPAPLRSTTDTVRHVVLTLCGLAALVLAFVFLMPRQADVVQAPAASEKPLASDRRPGSPPKPDGTSGKEIAARTPSAPQNRAVGPAGTSPGPAAGPEMLSRIAPRAPLALPVPVPVPPPKAEATEKAKEEASATRLRLLPRPVAIDTATFLVGTARVELAGVRPVAPSRECRSAGGGTWPCGMQARTELRNWLRARSIRCDVPEAFAQSKSTMESACSLGSEDIGEWLIRNGWAAAAPGGPYEAAERQAREQRRGVWGSKP